jgi:hypothetical protein
MAMNVKHIVHELKMKRLQRKMQRQAMVDRLWAAWEREHGDHGHCARCNCCLVGSGTGTAGFCSFHWDLFVAKEER